MVALRFGPGVVADDVVVKLALAYGGAIEIAPAFARLVEVELDLSKHVVHPLVVEPGRPGKLGADFGEQRRRSVPRLLTPIRVAQFLPGPRA